MEDPLDLLLCYLDFPIAVGLDDVLTSREQCEDNEKIVSPYERMRGCHEHQYGRRGQERSPRSSLLRHGNL